MKTSRIENKEPISRVLNTGNYDPGKNKE